ncbi:MAG: lipid-A-disaccharide synthase [Vicinamibacterales bacterium]
MTRVLLSCGEASGDLYAGALVRALQTLKPGIEVSGLGGARFAAAGARLLADYRGMSVTGLVEVVRLLPRTWRTYREILAAADRARPDVFVPVDYPDFNFRLGQALSRRGIPVVYYISPQLWAWRPGRLKTIARFVDRMLVIFPFEEELYRRAGVPVEFVGHPLVDLLAPAPPREEFLTQHGLSPQSTTVGLLPGSRPNEVSRILAPLLDAARDIAHRRADVQFIVARAPGLDSELFAPLGELRQRGLSLAVVENETDAALSVSDVVVTASGTATVQTAFHDRPMVIVYRLSPLTYTLGVRLVNVTTYGMVNLVAGSRIVPELIQDACTGDAIARAVLRYLDEPAYVTNVRKELARVRERLGGAGASERAARAILQEATSPSRR